ncbi:MAG: GntR family transcriptional regulator [Prolixibacteraceae bacterium]|jgi:DNA-binding transcriptional regulator YhcF (GntR family)|nr:GntR family transcriptional regulator [Prolixibacteraceae bacterium]
MHKLLKFKIDSASSVPKYRQLVDAVLLKIETGQLVKGDKIPSLNELCSACSMSRDTAMMALNELKTRGVLMSHPGKGYFVINTQVDVKKRVFVLFDEMNAFKEDIYNSFINNLESNIDVDIYFHHFNLQFFTELIEKAAGNYTHYVIMPATFDKIQGVMELLSAGRVIVLDRLKNELSAFGALYQDFESDVFEAMTENESFFTKYSRFVMVHPGGKEPFERVRGVEQFCAEYQKKFAVVEKFIPTMVEKGVCYLLPSDRDLVRLIKVALENDLKLGLHIGVVSFNDTMLKEVVANGISTISTNFVEMGKTLAAAINYKLSASVRNPWIFQNRGSV